MTKIKIALVMPNHAHLHSSLHNYLKVYQYLVVHKKCEVTLFTDAKHELSFPNILVRKISGFDYGTPLEKVLFVSGVPRHIYRGLDMALRDFDVIISNNPEFYVYAYQAYRIAKKRGIRFLLRTSQTVDGFFGYGITRYVVNPLVRGAYDYAQHLIFTNQQGHDRCVRLGLIDADRESIITGHATDVETFKEMDVDKPPQHRLLSVGGLYKIKGHHFIISALANLISRGYTDCTLQIVGTGYYEDALRSHARSLGVEDSVVFLGAQDHTTLVKTYNTSSVFVLANLQEVTPAVNEALACGIPVVAMETGGLDSVIRDNDTGLVSKKFDTTDMTDKIQALFNDGKHARLLARSGKTFVTAHFSIKAFAEKLFKACVD